MNIELLDPLCTMVKLIQLNFLDNTKLSIRDHVVSLQSKTQYQCITRYMNGDSRNNVADLYYALIRLIKWFIVETSENIIDCHKEKDKEDDSKFSDDILDSEEEDVKPDDGTKSSSIKSTDSGHFIDKYMKKKTSGQNKFSQTNQQIIANNDKFRKLVNYLISALEKLQLTYKEGLVVLSLQFYINCITGALAGKFVDVLLPPILNDDECGSHNLLDYNKIKNFWDVKDIEYIYGLYSECFSIQNDMTLLPETKMTYINGKIKNVDSILEMNEKKFLALINNSHKG